MGQLTIFASFSYDTFRTSDIIGAPMGGVVSPRCDCDWGQCDWGQSHINAHFLLRKRAMRLSADWRLSFPARMALMAHLASAAVSCRHVWIRRWRKRHASISCSSAGNASAWVRTRSKVKAAPSSILSLQYPAPDLGSQQGLDKN